MNYDTTEFVVFNITRWWSQMGEIAYPKAREILTVVNGGGIEGSRSRLWKYALHQWTQREDLKIVVCHFPPGTSKWNKIEHQVFETSARTGAANS